MTTAHPGIDRTQTRTLAAIVESLKRFTATDALSTRLEREPNPMPPHLREAIERAVADIEPIVIGAEAFYEEAASQPITLGDGMVLTPGSRYLLTIREQGNAYRKPKARRLVGWTLLKRTDERLRFRSPSGGMTKDFGLKDGALYDWSTPVDIEPVAP